MTTSPVQRALGGVVLVAILAGCATDPRTTQGTNWVVEAEKEKQRLDNAGFPQFTGSR